jgi:hypothetical protein
LQRNGNFQTKGSNVNEVFWCFSSYKW